jgi:hypothetical protein
MRNSGLRHRLAGVKPDAAAVYKAYLRVRIHQLRGTLQRTRGEQVVCRQQDGVVSTGPGEAFVVGGNMAHILQVAAEFHIRVLRSQFSSYFSRVIRRCVVYDEQAHIHAGLGEHALSAGS